MSIECMDIDDDDDDEAPPPTRTTTMTKTKTTTDDDDDDENKEHPQTWLRRNMLSPVGKEKTEFFITEGTLFDPRVWEQTADSPAKAF